jgi:hypothetical protein
MVGSADSRRGALLVVARLSLHCGTQAEAPLPPTLVLGEEGEGSASDCQPKPTQAAAAAGTVHAPPRMPAPEWRCHGCGAREPMHGGQ